MCPKKNAIPTRSYRRAGAPEVPIYDLRFTIWMLVRRRRGEAKRPTAPHRAHAKRAGRTIGQKRSFCPQGAEVVRYRSVKANAKRNFGDKVSCWLESVRS